MSTTAQNTKRPSNESHDDEQSTSNWTAVDLQKDLEKFVDKTDNKDASFKLIEARFSTNYPEYTNKPDKIKQELKSILHKKQVRTLKDLQAQVKDKVNDLRSFKVFTEQDKNDFLSGLEVDTSNVETVNRKIKNLRTQLEEHLPKSAAQLSEKDGYFWNTINGLASRGVIGQSSVLQWQKRYLDSSTQWYKKYGFLDKEFPRYVANWEAIHSKKQEVLASIKKAGFTGKDHEHFAKLTTKDYLEQSYSSRTNDVQKAEAALSALEKGGKKQLAAASKVLDAAISAKILASNKKGGWLKEIFNEGTTYAQRESFITGRLLQLRDNWAAVKYDFTLLEGKKAKANYQGSFNFANLATFLSWNYNARVAYINTANDRLNERTQPSVEFIQIQKELDKKDFANALQYIAKIRVSTLASEERTKLHAMKQFALTQIQTAAENENLLGTKEKQLTKEEEFKAFEEVMESAKRLGPAYLALCIAAAKQGKACLDTVSSLLLNGLQLEERKRQAITKTNTLIELEMQQQEKQIQSVTEYTGATQKQIVQTIDEQITQNEDGTTTVEDIVIDEVIMLTDSNNTKTTSLTSQPHNAVPKLDVMQIGSSGSGIGVIISRCSSEQNNGNFLQNCMLTIEGVPSTAIRYAIQHLNPKISANAQHITSLSA